MILGLSECSAFWECILETMLNCLFVVFGFSAPARFPPWLATVLVEGTQVAFFEAVRILSRLQLDLIGLLLSRAALFLSSLLSFRPLYSSLL